jgi:hypothetical protein
MVAQSRSRKPKIQAIAWKLEIIQEEARSSKGRRDRIFAAGCAKGFEEGKESGFALGLAVGLVMAVAERLRSRTWYFTFDLKASDTGAASQLQALSISPVQNARMETASKISFSSSADVRTDL